MIFLVIHKSQHAHRTWCDIKEFFHISFISERKSGNAKLGGYFFCLKLLVSGKEQQVKIGFLAVAEEKVFADYGVQHFIYILAGFNGHECFMVNSLIGYLKSIQKIISTDFFFQSSSGVCGTSVFEF